ncbi:FAD-dependent monooxygenase [Streptomyces sp. UNOC14_S4]|uniref:FAD-dependent monooxygenase n=1 Tax=Streptomyces sp. UNOC14_S4 TaxID=2872340 RepID=UPI0027E2F96B|nr:FAD-dependent monooxygenase [Streptomyces sp. UNOC14_S4]
MAGAGPVGLTLAVGLAWRGVRHLVLEQPDGTVGHPKAGTVGPRSMELFRRWGLADRIRAAGWPGVIHWTSHGSPRWADTRSTACTSARPGPGRPCRTPRSPNTPAPSTG